MKKLYHFINITLPPFLALMAYSLVFKFNVYIWFWPSIGTILSDYFWTMVMNIPLYIMILVISTPIYLMATLFKPSPLIFTVLTITTTYTIVLYLLYNDFIKGLSTNEADSDDVLTSILIATITGIFIHTYLLWARTNNATSPNKALNSDSAKSAAPVS